MADQSFGPEKCKFDGTGLQIQEQITLNNHSRSNGQDMTSIMGSSPFFVSEHRLEYWNPLDICTDSRSRVEMENRLTEGSNYTQREDSSLKLSTSLMHASDDTDNRLSLPRKEKFALQNTLSTNGEDQIIRGDKTEQLMIGQEERVNSNSFPSQCSLTPLNSFSFTTESDFIETNKRLAEPVLRDFLTDVESAKDEPYVCISRSEGLQTQDKQNDANYYDPIKLITSPVYSGKHEFDGIKTNLTLETRNSLWSKLDSTQGDLVTLTALPEVARDKSEQPSRMTDLRVFKQGALDASSVDGSDWSSQECAGDLNTYQGNSTKEVCVSEWPTVRKKISQNYKILADKNQLNGNLRTGDKMKDAEIDNSATENDDPMDEGNEDVHEDKDKDVAIVGTLHGTEDNVTNPRNGTSTQLSGLISSPKVNNGKKTTCKFCNKLFKLRKDLKKHLKTHTGSIKYACSVCNSSFANRTLLKKHLLSHSDVKFFTCSECPVKCRSFAELKSHKRKHNKKAETFLCTDCPYKSSRQKDLIKHMRTHSPEKVYKCQFCQFSSKRKYSLQRHLKTTHSSCQTAKCPLCHLDSKNVDDFKSHIAMHAMFRTSYCIICQAFFKRKKKLMEHLLIHSADEDDGTCRKCGKTYASGHEYILHLLKHKKSLSSDQEDKESSQDSFPDPSTQSSLNHSLHKDSAAVDFQATKSKLIMDTPAMEAKLAQMSTVAARLADMTKVVTLLNEKSHVVFQLAEISTLATELAVMSGNVLHSYKNTYDVTNSSEVTAAPRSVDVSDVPEEEEEEEEDESSIMQNNESAVSNKAETVETSDCSEEGGMQIQVDLNGEPVSCVQQADPPCENNDPLQAKRARRLHCVQCNLVFTDSRSLKRHLLCHDDVRPYSCARCGQTFRRNEHLKKHMVTHTDERPFKCTECSYTAKTEHRLKIHMLSHSQNKTFFCNHCTYAARTNYELNHHMKRHEPRSCSQCSFVCFSRSELKKHVFTHSSFICGDCDFTTSDRAEYTKHTKKHSLVQHLCCELCGYSCDTMKKFKYHKLRHENKTPYQCTDCDYKCSSRASFDCHRLKHAGLKPFLCSFCGSSFRKTSHLNQHLLIHKEEKSFECGECGYSCRTKHNLKEHMMTHSGEKPFTCRFCNFSCRRNKVLQQHMCKHDNQVIMVPPLQMPTMPFSQLQIPIQMPLMPSVL